MCYLKFIIDKVHILLYYINCSLFSGLKLLNMGEFPSGQRGQTVNLLLISFGGSNPPSPTRNDVYAAHRFFI